MEIIAVAVPSMADRIAVKRATWILILKDSAITLSLNSSRYQSNVKPIHWAVEGLALNEYRITLRTGRYNKTKKSDR
jgi:hypothetical protein